MSETINVPWSRKQVAALNEFQQSKVMHPFTCGQRDLHPHNEGVLLATRAGWRCPAYGCRYEQNWAHAFMADRKAWERLRVFPPRPEQEAPSSGEPTDDLNSDGCSPEHEATVLRDELASMRRKLGAAKAEVAQTRQQLRSAEDELGRLRRENAAFREREAALGVFQRGL